MFLRSCCSLFRSPVAVPALSIFIAATASAALFSAPSCLAQSQSLASGPSVTLQGNVPQNLTPDRDLGPVGNAFPMQLSLVLQRTPEQEAALADLTARQNQPGAPEYQQWLTPQQFGERFGAAPADILKLSAWLKAQGFQVKSNQSDRSILEFSATAGDVETAFHTHIHLWNIAGSTYAANLQDPSLPAELANLVAGIRGLSQIPSSNALPIAVANDGTATTVSERALISTLRSQAATQGHIVTETAIASATSAASVLASLNSMLSSAAASGAPTAHAASVAPAAALAIPATPVVSPLGTSAAPYAAVTITDATPGAHVYYLINGGIPILYTGPFQIAASETIQAVAVNLGGGAYTVSPVNSQVYTVPVSTTPTWTQITTLPSLFATQGGSFQNAGDANLYGLTVGAPPRALSTRSTSHRRAIFPTGATSPHQSCLKTEANTPQP